MDHDPPSQVLDRNESSRSPAATTLREGLLCISCGYDLRGSPPGGRCPECGTKSPARNLLNLARFGGEAWLRRADRQIRRWLPSVIVVVGSFAGAGLLTAQSMFSWPRPSYVGATIGLIVAGASPCVLARGVWALSARHPVIDRDEPFINARRLARISLIGGIASVALLIAYPLQARWPAWLQAISFWLALPIGPAAVVGVLGLTYRVAHLCQAANDGQARRWALLVGTLYAAACILGTIMVAVAGFVPAMMPFLVSCVVPSIGVLGLLSLYTPCYLKRHLSVACAELAKQQNAVTMPRGAEETDEVPSSTQ